MVLRVEEEGRRPARNAAHGRRRSLPARRCRVVRRARQNATLATRRSAAAHRRSGRHSRRCTAARCRRAPLASDAARSGRALLRRRHLVRIEPIARRVSAPGRRCQRAGLAEPERRHVDVDALVAARAGGVGLVPHADGARRADRLVERALGRQVLGLAVGGVGEQLFHRAPVLQRDRSCGRTRARRAGEPSSGRRDSSFSMRGIAAATGHHLATCSGALTRMPIRKTTKLPSSTPARRSARIIAAGLQRRSAREDRGPPVVAQQAVDLDVVRLALAHPALAQQAFAREAEAPQQRRRGAVARVDLGLDPAQAHRAECVAEQRRRAPRASVRGANARGRARSRARRARCAGS